MNKLLIILFFIFGYFGWKKFHPKIFSNNKLPTIANISANQVDTCVDKKMCAIAYIAPWCPACHSITPHLKTFIENAKKHDEYGILVIIGAGTEEQNQSTHRSFASNAIIDNGSKIAPELSVSYFPTLLVIDENRKVIKRDQEAMNWMQQTFN